MKPLLAMLGLDPEEVKENLTGFVDSLKYLASAIEDNNMMLNYLCSLLNEKEREELHKELQNLRRKRRNTK